MHVEPFGVAAMPHTRLLRLTGARAALTVHVLRQTDVGDARGVLADQVDVGVEDGGVHWLTVFTQHCMDGKECVSTICPGFEYKYCTVACILC